MKYKKCKLLLKHYEGCQKKIIIFIMTLLFAVVPCSVFAKSGIIIVSSAEKGEKVSYVDLKVGKTTLTYTGWYSREGLLLGFKGDESLWPYNKNH